jgi:hypothetical protein
MGRRKRKRGSIAGIDGRGVYARAKENYFY